MSRYKSTLFGIIFLTFVLCVNSTFALDYVGNNQSNNNPSPETVADFNQDGSQDLLVKDANRNTDTLYLNNGNANFTGQAAGPMTSDLLSLLPSTNLTTDSPGVSPPNLTQQSSKTGRWLVTKDATTAALEQSIHQQINAYRAARGLSALALKRIISNVSRSHSKNMAAGKVPFGHKGFQARAKRLARAFVLKAASENVAFNQGFSDPDARAVNGWLNSPGHLKNIEGNYNLTGIGVTKNNKGEYYVTQIFCRR